jgi:hypothetical protein
MPNKHNNKPVPLPPISVEDIERFKAKVNTEPGQGPNGDCHAFMGARTPRGYGVFEFCCANKATSARANRVSYAIHNDEDPFPDLVLHSCDWKPCVRGEHMMRGDHVTNMRQAAERNRMASGDKNGSRLYPERLWRGSKNTKAKINEAKASEIRSMFSSGMTATDIALKVGLAISTVCRIVKGQGWAHANGAIFTGNLAAFGEKHRGSVLTVEIVKEMRKLKLNGLSYQSIADRFGVSLGTAHSAITRKTWKSVP